MFRVNFGNGQISQRFRTKREATAYIESCKSVSDDPYAHRYFVQRRDAEGWWV